MGIRPFYARFMTLRRLATMAAVLALVAGCGSSGQSPAAAKTEITTVWTQFFGSHNAPVAALAAEVENGETLSQVLATAQANPSTKGLSARVTAVDLLASADCKTDRLISPCAKVTYDLLNGGSPLLSGSTGFAVRQAGHWKLSKKTICGLLSLTAPQPIPACSGA